MTKTRLLMGVICLTFTFLIVQPTIAQIDPRMPEGPNRELVARVCTGCHDLGNLLATVGRTRDGWDTKIDDMVLYGMKIAPEQRALVLEYLATYLKP
jgi:hypothetical protein